MDDSLSSAFLSRNRITGRETQFNAKKDAAQCWAQASRKFCAEMFSRWPLSPQQTTAINFGTFGLGGAFSYYFLVVFFFFLVMIAIMKLQATNCLKRASALVYPTKSLGMNAGPEFFWLLVAQFEYIF